MNYRFTDKQNLLFVQLYGAHSVLWDSNNLDYKNKASRDAAMNVIIDNMGISGFGIAECKWKIKNIRSHYSQELKKSQESIRNGDIRIYKPAVPWFDTLDSFLRNHTHQRPRFNIQLPTEVEFDNDDSTSAPSAVEEKHFPHQSAFASTSYTDPPTVPSDSEFERTPPTRKRGLDNRDVEVLDNALKLLQSSTDVSHDPYYTYGLHIANELRRYDPQTLAHVKRAFADILFRADLGQLVERNMSQNNVNYRNNYQGASSHGGDDGDSDKPPPIKQVFLPATFLSQDQNDTILP